MGVDDAREASHFDMDEWASVDGHLLTIDDWINLDFEDTYPLDFIS